MSKTMKICDEKDRSIMRIATRIKMKTEMGSDDIFSAARDRTVGETWETRENLAEPGSKGSEPALGTTDYR